MIVSVRKSENYFKFRFIGTYKDVATPYVRAQKEVKIRIPFGWTKEDVSRLKKFLPNVNVLLVDRER